MEPVAWLAAALVFASFFMKTIVPLRLFAIASNLAFIAYGLLAISDGIFAKVAPILVLHCALLPLNLQRLRQTCRPRAEAAVPTALPTAQGREAWSQLLSQHGRRLSCPAGTVLFSLGDPAGDVYELRRGAVRIVEFDRLVQPGELFGEVGVFADSPRRTATAVCLQDCELLCVDGRRFVELFQHDGRFALQMAQRLSGYARGPDGPQRVAT